MTKYLLPAVSFLAVFTTPSFAENPARARYDAAYALLQEAESAAIAASLIEDNTNDPLPAVQTLAFAREAAGKAADDMAKGGDARKNALAAADTAVTGANFCTALALTELNPDAQALWLLAASKANEAAILLNKNLAP